MAQYLDAEVSWKAITGMRKTQTEGTLCCILQRQFMPQIKYPVGSAVWVTSIFRQVQPNSPLYVEKEKKKNSLLEQ
jgi:hypothetical protein